MNERIKDLLKQATRELNPDDRVWVFSKVDQAKFAELIVKECAWLVDENDISLPYGTFGKLIKEHFGVKE
jgi:hypothetical protein